MKDNPGFRLLREAFARVSKSFKNTDVSASIVRSLAAGGKGAVEHAKKEFPKETIQKTFEDLYGILGNQETADGLSTLIRSLDEETIQNAIDGFASKLKNEDIALKIAKQFKDVLNKGSAEDLTDQLAGMLGMAKIPFAAKMIAETFLQRAKPILEDMKDASEEEIADKIVELVESIPSDVLAMQIAAYTSQVTPEFISEQTSELLGKIISPETIADIMYNLADTMGNAFDDGLKITKASEAPELLRQLFQDMARGIQDAKNEIGTGGGSFIKPIKRPKPANDTKKPAKKNGLNKKKKPGSFDF